MLLVLICVVSLALQSSVSLNIHNQCQAIKLMSPVYFIHSGRWKVVPDSEIGVNVSMRNRIELDAEQDILEGALAYKIQHTESTQDESKRIWLLIAWHGKHTKEPLVCVSLAERNKRLDEDKLRKVYQRHWPSFKDQSKSKWELNGTTMLVTTIRVTDECYRWDVFISEERK
jgi:hypothetical protein